MFLMLMQVQKEHITLSINKDLTLKHFQMIAKEKIFLFLKQMHNNQFLNNANAKCMQPLIIFNMIK